MDRNTSKRLPSSRGIQSLSARRAWIEIGLFGADTLSHQVALRKESVDRNMWWGVRKAVGSVALRKESVDRNFWRFGRLSMLISVALRKESVDRNVLWG